MDEAQIRSRPIWQQRFLAPSMGFPHWAAERPERVVAISNLSGVFQAWAVDLATGERRQITDTPVGVTDAHMRPDGSGVVWWLDDSGNEQGCWMVTPWVGGEPERLVQGIPDGWNEGIGEVGGAVVVALAHGDHDYRAYVARGGAAREIYRSGEYTHAGHDLFSGGALSADGTLACLHHSESGDMFASGARVISTDTGETVGELHEPPHGFQATAWSPLGGDQRLAVISDRTGWVRPSIWDLSTGAVTDLPLEALGDAWVLDWWPDATAVLVLARHETRTSLHRVELTDGVSTLISDRGGEITVAAVRPDGAVWYQRSSGEEPSGTFDGEGNPVLPALEPLRPPGHPMRSIFASNSAGDRIQGFVAQPVGEGPFATVVYSHGGPTGDEDADRYEGEWSAYVDAGYAVVTTNYRGSEGYGTAFRDAMRHTGEMGDRQTEDILAVLDVAIDQGVADPERLVFSGWSWGGYMGLYMAGRHPERRWRAIFSGVPAAELVSAHWESSPELQAYDRAIMGGTPSDVRDRFDQANPITYVEGIDAPILVIAGDNDIRCSIGQVLAWCEAFEASGGDLTLYRFATGHGSNESEETVGQIQMVLDFFAAHLVG